MSSLVRTYARRRKRRLLDRLWQPQRKKKRKPVAMRPRHT